MLRMLNPDVMFFLMIINIFTQILVWKQKYILYFVALYTALLTSHDIGVPIKHSQDVCGCKHDISYNGVYMYGGMYLSEIRYFE